MNKATFYFPLIFLVSASLFLAACGKGYNTDFPPPSATAEIDEVFPANIDGLERNIQKMNYGVDNIAGFKAEYGSSVDITIEVIQTNGPVDADNYFQNRIIPQFDSMPNHFRGNINGKWEASGTDGSGREWFAWVNQNWIFVMSGATGDLLDKAVKEFKYVAP